MKKVMLLLLVLITVSCKTSEKKTNGKLNVVTTTTMVTDLVKNIGGDKIDINGLMGAGVDPHLYKASEGDVAKLFNADVIIYSGLHLEGKLVEVFEKMEHQNKKTIEISDVIAKDNLIGSALFASNYDPHIWFDITNWTKMMVYVADKLAEIDVKNADFYKNNAKIYLEKLQVLNKEVAQKINELSEEKRILVTAHDAFNYFGRQHKFNVVGLQGLSTATEAGVQDVQKLAKFIIDNKVKAIFVESSVPKRTIEALQEAVKSKGHEVVIGGTLYSDALGSAGTIEGTYIGMYKANVNTIVNALK
ncbi:metal ABC transporter solute-binding protein, Zn/Mn family [Tenacibaculum finnmarkense]|uniref:Zinc ABC transporter solute-binding protein n=1 Tax=Tenacibaculum finnmarkense genomovar finnmarkense TaxID=1458503 RepID=A0AAP1RGZ5_9FLAO|nr:zinc ABC transporter substrate-binding protein [Tenacibaculum finnmarkense]MBE7653575.1 zinc ABC transporter solute-binding protein [Tenacibaculum finnmarkense genomovar finnmarkense]MBE7695833.1 zinc ABC transporter solute-binding protein [Tenacibaculum finnmarkense genomovar finnmarkense]MCD8428066.1 zinc ABC transporter substrate-binding protein [Tenacibaculum finnmarkense genomovar finnmarkense]MCG8731791.1 zinc ABC transporter solute-binding protein [Tenacibaculum finnmarkense]MCG87518